MRLQLEWGAWGVESKAGLMADHTIQEAEKLLEVKFRPLMGNLRLREGEELAVSHRVAELGLESGSLILREWM